jgi:hypothetical protein
MRKLQMHPAAIWGMAACALLAGAGVGYVAQNHRAPEPIIATPATINTNPLHITYSGDGVFLVPGQVGPGTYIVTAESGYCIWERLKALTTRKADVLESDDMPRGAYSRMTVTKYDKAVRMSGCAWFKL